MAASSISLYFPQLRSTKFLVSRTRVHAKPGKSVYVAQRSAAVSKSTEKQKIDLHKDELGAKIGSGLASIFTHIRRTNTEMKTMPLLAEIAIDQGIISCRFFAVIAVVGSLIGSILCYVEGCFLMLESYFQGFHIVSQRLDQGAMIHMVIEAIDMFIIGTVMLSFGMGLYSMFIGIKRRRGVAHGTMHLKMLSDSSGMNTMSHAKTKLGHAVVMLLQVGVVERFKSVPLVTGLDLACFAGSEALFFSSASMFLLSRLRATPERKVSDTRKSHSMNVFQERPKERGNSSKILSNLELGFV